MNWFLNTCIKKRTKILLLQDLSEPELYDDLVYKLRKIEAKPEFSDQFSKLSCYKQKESTIMS